MVVGTAVSFGGWASLHMFDQQVANLLAKTMSPDIPKTIPGCDPAELLMMYSTNNEKIVLGYLAFMQNLAPQTRKWSAFFVQLVRSIGTLHELSRGDFSGPGFRRFLGVSKKIKGHLKLLDTFMSKDKRNNPLLRKNVGSVLGILSGHVEQLTLSVVVKYRMGRI